MKERKKRVYISGPITGVEGYEAAFDAAEEIIRKAGKDPLNPAKVADLMPPGTTWEEYMRVDLAIMATADEVYMLAGWKRSKGARIERELATARTMPITYEEDAAEFSTTLGEKCKTCFRYNSGDCKFCKIFWESKGLTNDTEVDLYQKPMIKKREPEKSPEDAE